MVIWKHALRNALIPVVTFVGLMFGILMGSAVVVEVVFAWPGLGQLAYQAVLFRDFPLLQGVVLIWAAAVMAVNLGIDLLYGMLDPRVRL
jgi:peptide/nickel transport system permease protein